MGKDLHISPSTSRQNGQFLAKESGVGFMTPGEWLSKLLSFQRRLTGSERGAPGKVRQSFSLTTQSLWLLLCSPCYTIPCRCSCRLVVPAVRIILEQANNDLSLADGMARAAARNVRSSAEIDWPRSYFKDAYVKHCSSHNDFNRGAPPDSMARISPGPACAALCGRPQGPYLAVVEQPGLWSWLFCAALFLLRPLARAETVDEI